MAFNAQGFLLATLATSGMADRQRATQLSLLGGVLGGNAATVLVLAAAGDGRLGAPATSVPAPTTSTATPSRVEIPEPDDDPEESGRILRARGLVPVITTVTSDDPIDIVMRFDPESGTVVRRGSSVVVEVSGGLEVPDVVGLQTEEAEKLVREAGFPPPLICQSERAGREDTVERQDPPGRTFVDASTEVELFLFQPRKRLRAADEPAESK